MPLLAVGQKMMLRKRTACLTTAIGFVRRAVLVVMRHNLIGRKQWHTLRNYFGLCFSRFFRAAIVSEGRADG